MQSIERFVQILDIIASKESGMLLVELTHACDISKTALFRITRSMCDQGLLYQDDSGKFYLGPRILSWMGKYQSSFILVKIARPIIEELHRFTGETIHLFHFRDGEAFYIDKMESVHPLTIRSRVGTTQPLYCTAGGKAILGSLPEDKLNLYLAQHQLEQRTPKTITSPQELREALKRARSCKYFEEIEENENGIRCIAVPLLDERNFPIGAVSITMPVNRAPSQETIAEWGEILWDRARLIESKLLQRGHQIEAN